MGACEIAPSDILLYTCDRSACAARFENGAKGRDGCWLDKVPSWVKLLP